MSETKPHKKKESIRSLNTQLRTYKQLFQELEWSHTDRDGDSACPCCGAKRFQGEDGELHEHNKGCYIRQGLEKMAKSLGRKVR